MLYTNYFIINHLPPVKTPIFAKVNDISENTHFLSERKLASRFPGVVLISESLAGTVKLTESTWKQSSKCCLRTCAIRHARMHPVTVSCDEDFDHSLPVSGESKGGHYILFFDGWVDTKLAKPDLRIKLIFAVRGSSWKSFIRKFSQSSLETGPHVWSAYLQTTGNQLLTSRNHKIFCFMMTHDSGMATFLN